MNRSEKILKHNRNVFCRYAEIDKHMLWVKILLTPPAFFAVMIKLLLRL